MSYGLQLDLSMDSGEEDRVKKKYALNIKELAKKTHFNRIEMEKLALIYHKILKDGNAKQEQISKEQFEHILHYAYDMTDYNLTDRVISTICRGQRLLAISFEIWIQTMSLYLRGTLEEKIEYCFEVYSAGTEIIGRETMYSLLRGSLAVAEDEAEDAVKDFIELIVKRLDLDRDGKITKNDYVQSVLKDPNMMECLGQILPSRQIILALATTSSPLAY